MKNIKNYILTAVFSAGVAGLATYCGFYLVNKDKLETGEKFSIIKECRDILAEKGSGEFNDEDAVIGAINGYLQSGGDKYTYYYQFYNVDPVEDNKNYINTSGTALASGFQVDVSADGNILLTDITPNLSADKQGLKKGDIITHIDGVSISEKGFENYANKILGKQDTETELTVNRDGEIFNMIFKRDNDLLRDVKWEMRGNVAYITISAFGMLSAGNMSTAMDEVGDADKFIIDLRNNPGGQNEYMIQAVDYFVDEGNVNYYKNNDVETDVDYTNSGSVDAPVIVLINENTASAAEIFTALCKQFGKNVTLVGTNTFGKGIFQEEADLSDGGKLHYTSGYFTVGDWECWQGKGISPDITVEMDGSLIGTDEDIQLKKAFELLQ
ncbi:MAG: PDZ domain-containing protein [Ruminococcus sp.]|nr:PDZ domain-containing protein [Ruminococcus sp.]